MKKLLTRAVFPLILVLAVGFLGFGPSVAGDYPAPSIHGAGGYDPNGGYSNDVIPGAYLVLYADNNSFAGSPNDVVLIDGSVASIVGDITSQINIFIGNLSGGDHSVKVITPGGQDSTGFTVRSATPSVVNGSCGTAFNSSFSSAPQSGLCNVGSASSISGGPSSGLWTWSCSSPDGSGSAAACSASVTRTNGSCGTSNGSSFSSAPQSGLCNVGSASSISGNGPWP